MSPSGRRAEGTLYHFSTYALARRNVVTRLPGYRPIPVDPRGFTTEQPEQDEPVRVRGVRTWGPNSDIVDKRRRDNGIEAYARLTDVVGSKGKISLQQFERFVKATDYATVTWMIEKGTSCRACGSRTTRRGRTGRRCGLGWTWGTR